MANETKTRIDIGGRTRVARMDLNVLAEIEERTGKNTFELSFWSGLNAREVRLVAWACLRHTEEGLTEEEVGRWVTMDKVNELASALAGLWRASLPEPEEGAAPSGEAELVESIG